MNYRDTIITATAGTAMLAVVEAEAVVAAATATTVLLTTSILNL
jgi:hypothetical protein